ncbi:ribbon-helix-helix protein, CopG family [Streptomyces sp. NPDC046832]|uniref:ribbon-helix-helix protein, CopG family n=1 Tax=Streptomyces sp. NPDC046832 TaxID=3155020 RepID=UPI0033D3C689
MTHQKISVNLSVEVMKALKEMAEHQNVTMTEVLRRSISIYKFLSDSVGDGKAVLLEDPTTKETEKIIFL